MQGKVVSRAQLSTTTSRRMRSVGMDPRIKTTTLNAGACFVSRPDHLTLCMRSYNRSGRV